MTAAFVKTRNSNDAKDCFLGHHSPKLPTNFHPARQLPSGVPPEDEKILNPERHQSSESDI